MAEAECRRAADAAEQAYTAAFDKSGPSEEADLNKEHHRCMALARQAYADGAIGARNTEFLEANGRKVAFSTRTDARSFLMSPTSLNALKEQEAWENSV